jgi:anti-sigma factor RsiW
MTTEESPCGFRDDLPAYVDRALDDGRHLALGLHLADCPSCRGELDGLVSLDQIMREHPPEIAPSTSFAAGFCAAFDAEIAPERVPAAAREATERAGFWDWLAKPVLIPMSAAAVAATVAVITWPIGDKPVNVVDRTIEPNAVERAVVVRPAKARPATSLVATEKELGPAIEKVVQEVDGEAKPDDKKLVEAGAEQLLQAEGVVPR